jgi:hypothetical protein
MWITIQSAKAGAGGADGGLRLAVPSVNRLDQTEPATFSIIPCWAFFGDSCFLYFTKIHS